MLQCEAWLLDSSARQFVTELTVSFEASANSSIVRHGLYLSRHRNWMTVPTRATLTISKTHTPPLLHEDVTKRCAFLYVPSHRCGRQGWQEWQQKDCLKGHEEAIPYLDTAHAALDSRRAVPEMANSLLIYKGAQGGFRFLLQAARSHWADFSQELAVALRDVSSPRSRWVATRS